MVCYEILNYSVYMVALAICGFGLWSGVLAGAAPIGLTLIPAIFGTAVIVIVVAMSVASAPMERYFRSVGRALDGTPAALRGGVPPHCPGASGQGCPSRSRCCATPIRHSWACSPRGASTSRLSGLRFAPSGTSPPGGVLVMGYYVGTLANTLPLPGGIGGVEGGMIGSFIAFGVSPPLAVLGGPGLPNDLVLAPDHPRRDRVCSLTSHSCRLARDRRRHYGRARPAQTSAPRPGPGEPAGGGVSKSMKGSTALAHRPPNCSHRHPARGHAQLAQFPPRTPSSSAGVRTCTPRAGRASVRLTGPFLRSAGRLCQRRRGESEANGADHSLCESRRGTPRRPGGQRSSRSRHRGRTPSSERSS